MFTVDLVQWAFSGTSSDASLSAAESHLNDVFRNIQNNGVKPAIIQTGWYGDATSQFLESSVVDDLKSVYTLYVNQLFDQPWKGLPADLPGMPGTLCNHVYPLAHLDPDNPPGPPWFPNGLTLGKYWFRVQPVSGEDIHSVDAIDIEFSSDNKDDPGIEVGGSGETDWTTLGKFTVDYPMDEKGVSPVKYIEFRIQKTDKSFTLYPPNDNAIADITLPGKPRPTGSTTSTGSDDDFTTILTLEFDPPYEYKGTTMSTCSVPLVISSGSDQGDQGGEAVLKNGAIGPGKPEQACFLELQNDQKTVNGGSFQFPLLAK
jgi:hypothetical protein